MPYKRPAADKSGMPVYQPSATTYQQLMQLQQQPFVPVSCEYTSPPPIPPSSQAAQVAAHAAASCGSPAAAAIAPPTASVAAQAAQAATETQVHHELAAAVAVAHAQIDSETVVTSASVQPPPPLPPSALDAAAIAKEVAQQNYAKAVKLAQVSQSYGFNSALTALNYTGVALNKQPVSIPPPQMQRYSALPFAFTGAAAPTLSAHPYAQAQAAAQQMQPNLLAFSRPPPAVLNPYSFLRPYPQQAAAAPTLLGAHHHQSLLAQYPQFAPQASLPQTPVSVAMSAQTNNNNVVLQPYKKMKTT